MEGRCERRDDGWWLMVPGGGCQSVTGVGPFPCQAAAEQAARLVNLHAALASAGQPQEEVQRLQAELEAHDPGCCDDEVVEELRLCDFEQLLDMLRAVAAGEWQDSAEDGATVSTAAAPPQACAAEADAADAVKAEAGVGEPAASEQQQQQEEGRPQQHELLQEPATQPQSGLLPVAPQQAAPQQQPVQQQQPQQQQTAPQQQLYQHYFGVLPQVPHPSVTSYKAQLSILLTSAGQPQRPSRAFGSKRAQQMCLLACPSQAEAAAARDLGALWREHRLWGGRPKGKTHPFHRALFNFDQSRWEQDQPELLAAVRQCSTFYQLRQLLAIKMADGTLRALGPSMPRDAASWQAATHRAARRGSGSKAGQRSLKRALNQLAPGRGSSWAGLLLEPKGGAAAGGEEQEGGGRPRRHTRPARNSASLSDSFDYGYDSDPGAAGEAAAAPAAAAARLHWSQSAGAAQAALLGGGGAQHAQHAQQGQGEALDSSMATDGTGTPDEWDSDYLGVRLCPGGTWRTEVVLRLDALGAPSLDGFKCRQPVELGTELEAALVRDLGLLWFEQHCGPEAFREERLWNFALRRYLLDAPLWGVLAQLPHWPAFASYLAQLQASGQLLAAAKSYDEGELPAEWPDPYPARPLEQQQQQQQPQQQQQQPAQKKQRQAPRRQAQPQQAEAGAGVVQRGRRARQRGRRSGREHSPGLTTAEAAAAARACKAAADAAAANAPPEPWEQLAATWRQQSRRRGDDWEAAVQPYDTSWLMQAGQLQRMLCPAPAEGPQQGRLAGTAGGNAAKGKAARRAPAAAPSAAHAHAPGAARGHKRQQQQQQQQQQQVQQPQQPQQPKAQQIQQRAKQPPPGQPKQPQPMQQVQQAQQAQQVQQAQQAQHQQSSDEAATAVPAAAQPAPSHARQQERTPPPAAAGAAPPAQQAVQTAAPPAVHASPATPAIQLTGAVATELQALLDALHVSPHLPDGDSISQRQPPPVPAPGDVLLFCRRTSGMAGLPLLERLLLLSADALDPPSPRLSHRCTCLLLAQGANPLQLDPPPAGPALKAVEVGPAGFKAKLLAVRTTAQWSVVGHVAAESMGAVHRTLAVLDLR